MARRFTNGTSDEIDYGSMSSLNGLSAFTISFWLRKRNTTTAFNHVVCKMGSSGGGFIVIHGNWGYGDNGFYLELLDSSHSGGDIYFNNILSENVWHHIAVRFDGSKSGNTNRLKLFKDGTEVSSAGNGGTIPATLGGANGNLRIGGTDHEADVRPDDDIEHVAIWDRALTDEQIKSLANGLNPARLAPVFYAPLLESGSARDIIGGVAGSISGTSLVDGPPRPAWGAPVLAFVIPDTTVGLTGSSVTTSTGTLGAAHTSALTGSSVTTSTGTLGVTHTSALTGSSVTTSTGTLGVTHTSALTGSSVTTSTGTLAGHFDLGLIGIPVNVSAGVVSAVSTQTVALVGEEVQSAAGMLSAVVGGDVTLALSGVSVSCLAGLPVRSIVLPLQGATVRTYLRYQMQWAQIASASSSWAPIEQGTNTWAQIASASSSWAPIEQGTNTWAPVPKPSSTWLEI